LPAAKDTKLKTQFQCFTCNKTFSLSPSRQSIKYSGGNFFYPSQQMVLALVLSSLNGKMITFYTV